jgi:hypothetical protein
MAITRRAFLTAGALGTLVLAAGGAIYRAAHTAPLQRYALDGEARAALAAIVPALLAGVLPDAPAARARAVTEAIDEVQGAIATLPLPVQKEVQDLFGLLALAPARRLLTGIAGPWQDAAPEQVAAFLQDWRLHRLALLRTAYGALHDLTLGAWYAQSANWAAIGYPGPIPELS